MLAFVESGGPIPGGGFARGRGSARFRTNVLEVLRSVDFEQELLIPQVLLRFICTGILLRPCSL